MELTKELNKELDSCKQQIKRLELLIEKANIALDLYIDTENTKEYTKALDMVEQGNKKIRSIVSTQAQSMNIPYDVCLDLIFDRDYIVELLKNNVI